MMILKTLPWKRTWIATKTVIGWMVDEPTHRYASLNTGQIPHTHAKRLCDSHRHTAPCSVWGSVWWRLVTYSHKVSFEFGLESKGGLDAARWNLPRMRRLWSPPPRYFSSSVVSDCPPLPPSSSYYVITRKSRKQRLHCDFEVTFPEQTDAILPICSYSAKNKQKNNFLSDFKKCNLYTYFKLLKEMLQYYNLKTIWKNKSLAETKYFIFTT